MDSQKRLDDKYGKISKSEISQNCPKGLVSCIKEYCKYWNIISDCRYQRMHDLEEKDKRSEMSIAEADIL